MNTNQPAIGTKGEPCLVCGGEATSTRWCEPCADRAFAIWCHALNINPATNEAIRIVGEAATGASGERARNRAKTCIETVTTTLSLFSDNPNGEPTLFYKEEAK